MAKVCMTVAVSLWCLIGTTMVTGLQSKVHEKSALESLAMMSKQVGSMLIKEWDISKLGTTFLQSIVRSGFPSMGIPPLDPLKLEGNQSLDLPALPGIIEMEYAEFSNIEVTNLKKAYFGKLTIDPNLKIFIDLQVTQLNITGEWYNITGTLGDVIPFYGFGDFDLSVDAGIMLGFGVTKTIKGVLQISDLALEDLAIHEMKARFGNLMGGQGDIFGDIIGEVMGDILELVRPILQPDLELLIDSLQTSINDILLQNEVTMNKLIQCILVPDKCSTKSNGFDFRFSFPLIPSFPKI